ncbi:MAG: FemAB family XrtA/PEP-CTERM system-associated protein [Parasphingorhabdus sp.]|uniref:FemAB family XrtA/PEP-CTERM system-associated protein n=1 Tax=Parasphingorhabdus sp. TaxID=2709688 RepID=UPI0032973960
MNMPFTPDNLSIRIFNQKDPNEWARIDRFVMDHPDGTAFHRPAWLASVSEACGHDWCYILAEKSNGALEALLPLSLIHSALFGRALVSSGFAVGGGILSQSDQAVHRLAEHVWDFAKTHSFPSVELRGGPVPSDQWQKKDGIYAGFVTQLADDEEAQLLAIPRKQRAEVRKGLKNELTVRIGNSKEDRQDHYQVYAQSVRNLGTPVFPKKLFDAVMTAFGEDADILTVSNDGQPVASVLSLYHHETVLPYWGGGCFDARRLRANDVMYYALMNHGRDRGCRNFDFGRSKVGTGAYSFKKNWGFDPQPLSYATRAQDGEEVRDVNPMSPRYRLQVALWQKLPISIANRLGPVIAKGLG